MKHESQREMNHDKRETIWLEKVRSKNGNNMMFICGADHVRSFANKLLKSGFKVEILVKHWAEDGPVFP